MAARTTDSAVRAIIETDATITDLDPYIDIANELVTEVCVPAGYSSARLEKIERLLAAHFYCLKDMRIRRERATVVSEEKDTKLGLYFEHTHHGQMALILDTAGGLAALQHQAEKGLRQVIGVSYVGIEDEAELDELLG